LVSSLLASQRLKPVLMPGRMRYDWKSYLRGSGRTFPGFTTRPTLERGSDTKDRGMVCLKVHG